MDEVEPLLLEARHQPEHPPAAADRPVSEPHILFKNAPEKHTFVKQYAFVKLRSTDGSTDAARRHRFCSRELASPQGAGGKSTGVPLS